jgi:dienelactone hydrolase
MAAHLTTSAQEITIPVGESALDADLCIPAGARSVVLFAHSSGSSRKSVRNRRVAQVLQRAGLATLLLDLLTQDEEAVDQGRAHLRYDIPLLTGRLMEATRWVQRNLFLGNSPVGCFGASTGAAAALRVAARSPAAIGAVVSRGGRPDLAASFLSEVRAPTLLIVGRRDPWVLDLNRQALTQLPCEKRLEVIPHATHLFEEPGTLEQVAQLARDWFLQHLKSNQRDLVA